MTAIRRQGSMPRSAALIALTTLAVHQLRYLLAYGGDAHEELMRQGHAYLFQSLPVLIPFGLATIAGGLVRAAFAARPIGSAIALLQLRALLYATSIATIFALQESAEGLVFAGHASGLAAVFANGGWLTLPLALLFGALCALLDGGLARLESLVAAGERQARTARRPARSPLRRLSRVPVPLASSPLAFGLARRPPPSSH